MVTAARPVARLGVGARARAWSRRGSSASGWASASRPPSLLCFLLAGGLVAQFPPVHLGEHGTHLPRQW